MAKKTRTDWKAYGPGRGNSDMGGDKTVIDPFDYRCKVFIYGGDEQGPDEEDTEYRD